MKISALEEELTDLKVEKETLEKVCLVLALQRNAGFQLFARNFCSMMLLVSKHIK